MKSKAPKKKATKKVAQKITGPLQEGWVSTRTKVEREALAKYLFDYAVQEKLVLRFFNKYSRKNSAKAMDIEDFQSVLNLVIVQVQKQAIRWGRYKKSEIHGALLKQYKGRILASLDKLYTQKRKDDMIKNHVSLDELSMNTDNEGYLDATLKEAAVSHGDEEVYAPEELYIRRHEQLNLEAFLKQYQHRQNSRFGSARVEESKKNRTYDFYMAIRGGMKTTEIQKLLKLSEHNYKTAKNELQEVLVSYQQKQAEAA